MSQLYVADPLACHQIQYDVHLQLCVWPKWALGSDCCTPFTVEMDPEFGWACHDQVLIFEHALMLQLFNMSIPIQTGMLPSIILQLLNSHEEWQILQIMKTVHWIVVVVLPSIIIFGLSWWEWLWSILSSSLSSLLQSHDVEELSDNTEDSSSLSLLSSLS